MQRIILVTGGNRGIGLGICQGLARSGHQVLLGSRDLEKGRIVSATIDGDVQAVPLDMNDLTSMQGLVEHVKESYGRLDSLVNNAGIITSGKGLMAEDRDVIRAVIDTNVFGPMDLARIMLPILRESDDPRIINMSSGMGASDELFGNYGGYRLSKASLNAITQLVADELRGDGISVNAMCPGWVRTDMGGPNAGRSIEEGADTAIWLATDAPRSTGKFYRNRKEIAW